MGGVWLCCEIARTRKAFYSKKLRAAMLRRSAAALGSKDARKGRNLKCPRKEGILTKLLFNFFDGGGTDPLCNYRTSPTSCSWSAKPRSLAISSLAAFDLGVEEFLDASAVHAHEVIVVMAFVEFENGLAGFKGCCATIVRLARTGSGHGKPRPADIEIFASRWTIYVFSGQVAHLTIWKISRILEARKRGFQSDIFQIAGFGIALRP